MPDEGVLAELWAGACAMEAEMVRWLATPLLVVGLGVDGVAIWSRVQAQPILLVTEVQTPNVIGIDVLAAKAKIVDAGLTPGKARPGVRHRLSGSS